MTSTDLKKISRTLKLLLMASVIAFTWLASFYLATEGLAALPKITTPTDLAAILFGAASISLFIFSILVAIIAIYLWHIVESKLRDAVQEVTDKRLERTEREARGRSFAILGYVIGESSVSADFLAPINEERLREAIYYCETAYELFKDTENPTEFMALNNLLQYSCAFGDKSRRGYILEGARRLRAAAEQHDSPNLLLTYIRTILTFGLEPKDIREACSIVKDVGSNPRLNEKQKREAQLLTSLCRQCNEAKSNQISANS